MVKIREKVMVWVRVRVWVRVLVRVRTRVRVRNRIKVRVRVRIIPEHVGRGRDLRISEEIHHSHMSSFEAGLLPYGRVHLS
jgi:hypothetical protein